MKEIPINTGREQYRAIVGRGLLARAGKEIAKRLRGPRCAVIADANSGKFFAPAVLRSLQDAGFLPTQVTLPPGENAKSLTEAGRACEEMVAAGMDRTSFVVALGGGVVGDLAGFVAAIFHRGIPVVQMPTTLLAQVDSAIGGKTAVNTRAGKNLLGAVHQPALVLADVATLETLPPREFRQGFAEIIKHGIIADPGIFDLLGRFTREGLEELVARNLEIKAAIVARDELDTTGARAVLNFGHTVGHAIERAAGYGALLHGEAISLGMVAACEISVRRSGFPETDRARVMAALRQFELPTKLPADFPRAQILPALRADKKFERGEIRFVVSPRIGAAHLSSDVTLQDIEDAIGGL